MKKQDKEKKVGRPRKSQTEETRRSAKKTAAAGTEATQETAAERVPPAAISSRQVMPKVEGKLAARNQPGERSVVPVKPAQAPAPAEKSMTGTKTAAEKASVQPRAANEEAAAGFSKEYSISRRLCKVTFRLPAAAAPAARKVTIVGDFNDWDKETTLLKRQDNGDFAVTLDLSAGREYRFRYLIDGHRWENDWRADKYVRSPYGGDDSVVSV
jgi:hypothetical protein